MLGGMGGGDRQRRTRGAVISMLLLAAAAILAFAGGSDRNAHLPGAAAQFVHLTDLTAFESSLGHQIYWAGERPPAQLELREEAEGNVYLRYLPPGTEVGDPRAAFLTVGTYLVGDPIGALRRSAAGAHD